jgi:6-pyruvoyltetrahydropterin/6-carboxytetrahydropterin synthase
MLHGHHYVIEASVEGPTRAADGTPSEGMVVDFAAVKRVLRAIVAQYDHHFIVETSDPLLELPDAHAQGVRAVTWPPTAENIARAFLRDLRRVRVTRVRVYETPTSWADATLADL